MEDYNKAAKKVFDVLKSDVGRLYRYYQIRDQTLEDKTETMEMIDSLVEKGYIGREWYADIMLLVDFFAKKMLLEYFTLVGDVTQRINFFLDDNS